jgi:hypothetical protein
MNTARVSTALHRKRRLSMNQSAAEIIVEFLSFSTDHCDQHLSAIERFSRRQWERVLQWLDDAGLAFYFLQKLKDINATGTIPEAAFNRLQQNFEANQHRVEDMSRRFDVINRKFNDAGVRYAAVKGFSLVPAFCPYAPLRHQGDFDYLVDEQSLAKGRRILLESGYASKASPSRVEMVFVIPGGKPSRSAEQYSQRAPHAVELHTDMWDGDLNRLPHIPNPCFLDRAIIRHWNGLTFPALCDEDAFLLQVLHACHHLFTLWIRMSSFYEIGYFLDRRAHDAELWKQIEQRVCDSLILREFVVIVTELVSRLFASPVPPLIQAWAAKIRPASRIWIDHYARRCAFSELPAHQLGLLPTAKFILFLQQQFRDEERVGQHLVRKRLLPSSRLSEMVSSLKKNPSLLLKQSWWEHHKLVRRTIFHLLSGCRYLLEVPRWRWLNRNKFPIASS